MHSMISCADYLKQKTVQITKHKIQMLEQIFLYIIMMHCGMSNSTEVTENVISDLFLISWCEQSRDEANLYLNLI